MYYLCPKEINKNKMEISGKIIAVLEKQSGISKSGNNWASQEYVLETSEQYPKKICFRVFGEDKINQFAVKEGEILKVYFDIDASEWQGKWFNRINAWKIERVGETSNMNDSFGGSAPVTFFDQSDDNGALQF